MSEDEYKPPVVLTDRVLDLVERIGEALGRVLQFIKNTQPKVFQGLEKQMQAGSSGFQWLGGELI